MYTCIDKYNILFIRINGFMQPSRLLQKSFLGILSSLGLKKSKEKTKEEKSASSLGFITSNMLL